MYFIYVSVLSVCMSVHRRRHMPLISKGRQISEFDASLVCRVSSRTGRATQGNKQKPKLYVSVSFMCVCMCAHVHVCVHVHVPVEASTLNCLQLQVRHL